MSRTLPRTYKLIGEQKRSAATTIKAMERPGGGTAKSPEMGELQVEGEIMRTNFRIIQSGW
jgi:hypothetical protein